MTRSLSAELEDLDLLGTRFKRKHFSTAMNIIAVDTSTSIGFDESKKYIIHDVNDILNDKDGLVYFFNTRVDGHLIKSRIQERDFDMRGSSSIWDSLFSIIDKHRNVHRVHLFVLTDGIDTSSKKKTLDDIEYELWFLKLVKLWDVTWVYWKPPKTRICSFY